MKFIFFIFLTIYSFIINSQELKRNDLIGNWKFKKFDKTKRLPQDTTIHVGGGVYITYLKSDDFKKSKSKISDIKITDKDFIEKDIETDYWEISENKILLYEPVPKKKLEYYKKYTFNVIKKHKNGKYYYTIPRDLKILSLKNNQLVIEYKHFYNRIYEKH